MKQNNCTELSGHFFLENYDKHGPPEPQTPNPDLSQIFLHLLWEIRSFQHFSDDLRASHAWHFFDPDLGTMLMVFKSPAWAKPGDIKR